MPSLGMSHHGCQRIHWSHQCSLEPSALTQQHLGVNSSLFAHSATSPNHGIVRLTGATGGYLVGMLVASLALGYLADRKADQKFKTSFPALLLGDVIIFTFGLGWLHASLDLSWSATIAAGFIPFILGEALKIAITATSLPLLWRRISLTLNR